MKASKTEQRALLTLLNRIYSEILQVEEEWGILADAPDFRPRIEYFHDAIRAFHAAGGQGSDGLGRLSVEYLAYDIGMLRYIQADPLRKTRTNQKFSPHTQVTNPLPRALGDKSGLKPDSSVKYQLMDLYKSYSVLFAALLAEAAERNHRSRIEEFNTQVEDMATFMQAVAAKGDVQVNLEAIAHAEIDTGDVMNKILAALHGGKIKKHMQARDAIRKLKEIAQTIDKEQKAIDQAHFNYATGQLAIYEGARDTIKKMAGKGFNVAGQFVENAVRDAMRGGPGPGAGV